MDWGTLVASVGAALLSGGALGALAGGYTAKRESEDRRELLSLERAKWEHERDRPLREQQRIAVVEAMNALGEANGYALVVSREVQKSIFDPQVDEQLKLKALEVASRLAKAEAHLDALSLVAEGAAVSEFGSLYFIALTDRHSHDPLAWHALQTRTMETLKAARRAAGAT